LAVMADKYQVEAPKLLDTLKATLMPKASNEEMMAFCMVANQYDLNPFTKEIYAFPARSGGITPVVSVDGWAKLMNRHDDFDGVEFVAHDDEGKPHSVTCRIYLKGRSRPVEVTEYHAECARSTEPWKSHPRRMLRHKALIQAVRVAFGFSGIYDEDEAQRIAKPEVNVTPRFTATTETVATEEVGAK
jgi:phage recombination protein Bet